MRIYRQLGGNPEIPYYIRVYIIRNRWTISALYRSRIRDRVAFKLLSTRRYELQESVSRPEDAYSTATAGRVVTSLEELASSTDAYSVKTAELILYRLQEAVHVSDTYNMVKASRVERRLVEEVRAREVALQGGISWEEDPTKKIWVYSGFERVSAKDSLLWYHTVDGIRTGIYVGPEGIGYNYRGRELGESAHASDTYEVVVYEQFVRATKYDGHVEAEAIYNFTGKKYDGHVEAETIYNFTGTKYDGYTESSVTAS